VEQALLEQTERRAGGFLDASGFCSFSQLVEWCEPTRDSGLAVATPVLLQGVTWAVALERGQPVLGDSVRRPEFAQALVDLFAQLEAQCATPDALTACAGKLSDRLRRRLLVLADLWAERDTRLKGLGFLPPSAVLRLAKERLDLQGLTSRLLRFDELSVHQVHDVFPARLAFLQSLAGAAQRSGRSFALWWPASGSPATDVFVSSAVREIEALWQAVAADVFQDVPERPLAHVARRLFDDEATPSAAPALDGFSAATPREELRHLARRVRARLDEGVAPEALAVALRDLGPDTEAIVEAFEEFGIPVRARLGVPLEATAVARLSLSLLELADDGFEAGAVADVLESRAAGLFARRAPLARVIFAQAGVRNESLGASPSKGAYAVRLTALLDCTERDADRKAIALVRGCTEELLSLVRGIPASGSALALLEAWWHAVGRLGVFEGLKEVPPVTGGPALEREVARSLARDLSAAESLRALVAELRRALAEGGLGPQTFSRRDFARWLRQAAARVNVSARGPRAGAVWLLDVRELPGRHFEHLFLGGLTDGRFPGRPPPVSVLSEEERLETNQVAGRAFFRLGVFDQDIRLPLRAAEDRLLFHLALCAAERVTVSRPRVDEAGRELLASPFLEGLRRTVEGFREREVLEPRAAVPGLDRVRSPAELRARVALETLCRANTRQEAADPRAPLLRERFGAEPWFARARARGEAEETRLRLFSNPELAAEAHTGRVGAGVLQERLDGWLDFTPDHALSAAQLSGWGNCAFQGLLKNVLRLREVEEGQEELDPRTRGNFWHAALETLMPALQQEQLVGKDSPRVRALIHEAVVGASREIERRNLTGHPILWAIAQESAEQMLLALVLAPEALFPFGPRARLLTEVVFGEPRATEALRTVRLPAVGPSERDVYIRGRIDRLDEVDGRVGVLDYKSSGKSATAMREQLGVKEFQLPFYVLAARQWPQARRGDAAWLGLRDRKKLLLSQVLSEDPGLQTLTALDAPARATARAEGRANVANAVHDLLGRLRGGDFAPRPYDCAHCDFKSVCRISTRRVVEVEDE
jgi:RecB family exonuclease